MTRALTSLLLLLMMSAPLAAQAGSRRGSSATDLYERGLKQMRRGYYTRALESFNRVRNYHRDDPVSVKAQLAIADVYFKKGDFEQARFAYEEFASYHPRHENLDYVTWRIGLSIWKRAPKRAGRDQSATRGAVNVWTSFDTRFPGSAHQAEVDKLYTRGRDRLAVKELFIAKFYARRDAWGAVQGRTEYMLRRYPNSSHSETAMRYLGTALHAWGQVDQAQAIRARLAEGYPDSHELVKLDRKLARPPGERPNEKIFIRPYRMRGMSGAGAAPGGGGGGGR